MTPPVEPSPATPQQQPTTKPIHSLILDTGPLIKNDPPADVLRSRAEVLYTLPSIIPEIRDAVTRARVENTLLPFVTIRAPRPASVQFIQGFARRTGDLEVMSRPDVEILALAYELECERNGGDWRLRSTPGQKGLNGKKPQVVKEEDSVGGGGGDDDAKTGGEEQDEIVKSDDVVEEASLEKSVQDLQLDEKAQPYVSEVQDEKQQIDTQEVSQSIDSGETTTIITAESSTATLKEEEEDDDDDEPSSDDEGGWITPSNLHKHKAKDSNTSSHPSSSSSPITLQSAVLTSDFAMQNVALRMNLNLLSPQLTRISTLRTWVLRCHACFHITKAMDKRFCPSCGQPTLLRAACTVDDRTGGMTVHLKKNFQWNNRGNVYSVPKPVHGSSHGRAPKGRSAGFGGKDGWGRDLILTEDQKEYTRAADEQRRERKKDAMDMDYMPDILTGHRSNSSGGKIRVGAGRNVNSKKKH